MFSGPRQGGPMSSFPSTSSFPSVGPNVMWRSGGPEVECVVFEAVASCIFKSSPNYVAKFPVKSLPKYVVKYPVKCIPECLVKFYGIGCADTEGQFVGSQFEGSKMFQTNSACAS